MLAFLLIIVRVILIVGIFGLLLTIRKIRLRHIPSRQTHISRYKRQQTYYLNDLLDLAGAFGILAIENRVCKCIEIYNRRNANSNENDDCNESNNNVNDTKNKRSNQIKQNNAADVSIELRENFTSLLQQNSWLLSALLLWNRPYYNIRIAEEYKQFYNIDKQNQNQTTIKQLMTWLQDVYRLLRQSVQCAFTFFANYLVYSHYSCDVHAKTSNPVQQSNVNSSNTQRAATQHNEQSQQQQQQSGQQNNVNNADRSVNNTNMNDNASKEWYRHNKIISRIEKRVNAALQDRGIAAHADFRIHSLGEKPPRVRFISINQKHNGKKCHGYYEQTVSQHDIGVSTTNNNNNNVNINDNNTANSLAGAYDNHTETETTSTTTATAGARINNTLSALGTTANSTSNYTNSNDNENTSVKRKRAIKKPYYVPLQYECETELQYKGDLDIALRAQICFWRGRRLPLQIRVGAVRLIRCHVFSEVELVHKRAVNNERESLWLKGNLWFESNPLFDLQMHTKFSQFGIRNFFLIPLIVKYGFLYVICKHFRHNSNCKGIPFDVQII